MYTAHVIPDRGAVKSTCKMLMELGIGSRDVYEDDFERPLLEESREFYRVRFTYSCIHVCWLCVV